MSQPNRANILECAFDRVTMQAAVDQCVSWCKGPRKAHTVLTANASILCMKRSDPELERACQAADLTVADGVSVLWASRAVGDPLPERIAGVDFMAQLMEVASQHKLSVYFLGAKEEVLEELMARCKVKYPGAVIAGHRNGYFKEPDHAAIVQDIRASGAHILFVGMPTPFKEVWCQRYRDELNVPVLMGVGGSFDVHAGFIQRAPEWLQSVGMEWFWRLAMEPRKMWKRYLYTNSEFLWLTAGAVAKRRLGVGSSAH
jgi:N-acetylglucosaminyldiphosphoundecaprenol N-acetyl-beta-D-mannosaminyltransferase